VLLATCASAPDATATIATARDDGPGFEAFARVHALPSTPLDSFVASAHALHGEPPALILTNVGAAPAPSSSARRAGGADVSEHTDGQPAARDWARAVTAFAVAWPSSPIFAHTSAAVSLASAAAGPAVPNMPTGDAVAALAPLPLTTTYVDADDLAQQMCGHTRILSSSFHGFGPHNVPTTNVFYASRLSIAFVNIKPVTPGHILVTPRRLVRRFTDLYPDELADLMATAQCVGRALEAYHGANALTLAIQDGSAAGQTVPHVHVHVLPRWDDDLPLAEKDSIYDLVSCYCCCCMLGGWRAGALMNRVATLLLCCCNAFGERSRSDLCYLKSPFDA
jgi:diadenosine tetraphosphate (Ap4A) HIT family hydrolase